MENIHLLDEKLQKETADAPKKTTRHDKKKSGHTFPEKVASIVDVVMCEINMSNVTLRAGNGNAESDAESSSCSVRHAATGSCTQQLRASA